LLIDHSTCHFNDNDVTNFVPTGGDEMTGQYDESYKALYSNSTMIRQFIEVALPSSLLAQIDIDGVQQLMTESVSQDQLMRRYKLRHNDIVWRLPLKAGGAEAYLLLMLEAQAKVDDAMVLRVGDYAFNWLLFLFHSKGLRSLPAIFPVVLYHGSQPWHAKKRLSQMTLKPEGMKLWVDAEYELIDERSLVERGQLPAGNVLSALWKSVHSDQVDDLFNGLARTRELLERMGERREFIEQVDSFILKMKRIEDSEQLRERLQQGGMQSMKTFADWEQEFLQKGMQIGASEKAIEFAKLMVSDGKPAEEVHRYTGLSIEDIQKIRQKL